LSFCLIGTLPVVEGAGEGAGEGMGEGAGVEEELDVGDSGSCNWRDGATAGGAAFGLVVVVAMTVEYDEE
jgi:hypothetical protein